MFGSIRSLALAGVVAVGGLLGGAAEAKAQFADHFGPGYGGKGFGLSIAVGEPYGHRGGFYPGYRPGGYYGGRYRIQPYPYPIRDPFRGYPAYTVTKYRVYGPGYYGFPPYPW
jgi:hypothetical protein